MLATTGEKYSKDIAYHLLHKSLPGMVNGEIKDLSDIVFKYRFDMGSIENCSFVYEKMVDLANKLREKTIEVYTKCSEYAATKGVIIADTKFEFGLDENGELVIGDEVLTPDSSRFWVAKDYQVGTSPKSFDKQYLRDWIKSSGYDPEGDIPIPEDVIMTTRQRYIEAYEMLTGKAYK